MATDLITVHHGDPISKVRQLFEEHHLHHIPVVSGETLVGILSWTDLMRFSYADAFGEDVRAVDTTLDHTHQIEDLMNPDPVTLDANSGVRDAARILAGGDFHALPIVEGKKLVGMVTTRDLVKFLVDLF